MSNLPLKTAKFIVAEFEKKLSGFSIKAYKHDEFVTVYSLNDSLLIMVELYGVPAQPCSYAEAIIYESNRQNPYLEIPVVGKTYYVLRIAELTPNVIGFKYNHAKFVREMKSITNIWLLDGYISYAKYGSEKTNWWNPNGIDGPKLTDRINVLMPELHLAERISAWDGEDYNFIVIEIEDLNKTIRRAVAYTTQQPHSYIIKLCKEYIKTGKIHGNAVFNGFVERDINNALSSWKGTKRQERLEQHLQYFYVTKRLKKKSEAYDIAIRLYQDSNAGKYAYEPRSTYIRPVNKWVSEELVYRLTKKLYKDYAVVYQHRPFFLRSALGGQMSYDVFISGLNIAIEYQGRQHFEPVDFFGGAEAFKKLKKRDEEKAILSRKNGIKLVYINYWEEICPELIEERVGVKGNSIKKW